MKKFLPAFCLLISMLLGFLIFNSYINFSENNKFETITLGNGRWNLEIAMTFIEKTKGLSGRESNNNLAMLFFFNKEDFHNIWMKDMKFSIDIIWLDKNMRVVDMKLDTKPETYPENFTSKVPASYVLELVSGEAQKAQIKIGDTAKLF
jgi:uncharacterized protein